MKILITGGNGYVGREVCRQLLYLQHEVSVLDNIRYGDIRFRTDELSQFQLHQLDIRNNDAVQATINSLQPDVIIHLAAIHYIPECEDNPNLAISTNINGTVNLLKACPSNCRFVFASSGAVYQPEEIPHREDSSSLDPSDVYGFTKLHGEHYVRYFASQRSFPAVIVRLFNVIGPGETNPHVLPEIVAQLKAGYVTLQLGNLKSKRDYIGVMDAAKGFCDVATKGCIENHDTITVNLGTQNAYSVEYLLTLLKKISKINFNVQVDPQRIRKVDRPFLAADIGKIRELFDWHPNVDLEQNLCDLWRTPELSRAITKKYLL